MRVNESHESAKFDTPIWSGLLVTLTESKEGEEEEDREIGFSI